MKSVQFCIVTGLLATCMAIVCNAQASAQIAAAKNRGTAGVAAVGGPASMPDSKGGKPRFPIIPAGAAVKSANLPKANRQGAAQNPGGPRTSSAVVADQAAGAPALASTKAPTGATAQANKTATKEPDDAKSKLDKGNQKKKSKDSTATSASADAPKQGAAGASSFKVR